MSSKNSIRSPIYYLGTYVDSLKYIIKKNRQLKSYSTNKMKLNFQNCLWASLSNHDIDVFPIPDSHSRHNFRFPIRIFPSSREYNLLSKLEASLVCNRESRYVGVFIDKIY